MSLPTWDIAVQTRNCAGSERRTATCLKFHGKPGDQHGVGLGAAELMDICLAESEGRLSAYDSHLLRPTFVPAMVRRIRRFLPAPRKT